VVITGLVIPVKETLPKEAREQGSFWRSFEGFALVCKVLNFAVVPKYVALAVVEKRTASRAPAPIATAFRAKIREKWN